MLKMILDPMGGISLTNDGNAILREIDVAHPAAKNMIELSRTQDEECDDGTTSVIILAGEILPQSLAHIHPVVIISACNKALEESLEIINKMSVPINTSSNEEMLSHQNIDRDQVPRPVARPHVSSRASNRPYRSNRRKWTQDRRYQTVYVYGKISGGSIEESRVLDGVLLNKDLWPQM